MSRKIIESQNNDLLFRIREDLSEGKTYLTISKRNGSLINETIKDSELACKEFAFENYKISFNS
jgi:hypothetical protein